MRVGVVVVDADQACQVLLLRVCSGLWLASVYAWRGLFELQGYRCRSVYVRNQLSRTWLRLPVQPELELKQQIRRDFPVVPGSARNPGFEVVT
jgi:hypothetical protein